MLNKVFIGVGGLCGIQVRDGRAAGDCGELLVSLCYQPANDRLTVIVLKAKNLPRMDLTGLSGPCSNLTAILLVIEARTGLRHVPGVRPNRAADFRGRHFGP